MQQIAQYLISYFVPNNILCNYTQNSHRKCSGNFVTNFKAKHLPELVGVNYYYGMPKVVK